MQNPQPARSRQAALEAVLSDLDASVAAFHGQEVVDRLARQRAGRAAQEVEAERLSAEDAKRASRARSLRHFYVEELGMDPELAAAELAHTARLAEYHGRWSTAEVARQELEDLERELARGEGAEAPPEIERRASA